MRRTLFFPFLSFFSHELPHNTTERRNQSFGRSFGCRFMTMDDEIMIEIGLSPVSHGEEDGGYVVHLPAGDGRSQVAGA